MKKMNVLDTGFVKGFMNMCEAGFNMGWHERNGGNLSYRIKEEEIAEIKDMLSDGEWRDIGTCVPLLSGEYFLVTGSGRFFSNVKTNPEETIGIIKIDETGERYKTVWGLKGSRPTSELPTHLMNHEVKKKVTNGAHRVIYHAHTTNIIALTFVLPLEDSVFTHKLWEMATECPVVFPDGVGVVKWMVPGGRDIAEATMEKMKEYDLAVWAHHGMFASGPDFDTTFGLMHTAEKSAEILVKVMSVNSPMIQTITDEDLIKLAGEFGVTLNEKFIRKDGNPSGSSRNGD